LFSRKPAIVFLKPPSWQSRLLAFATPASQAKPDFPEKHHS